MKSILVFVSALVCFAVAPTAGIAQVKAKTLNLATIDKPKSWKTINVIANPVERDGRGGVPI